MPPLNLHDWIKDQPEFTAAAVPTTHSTIGLGVSKVIYAVTEGLDRCDWCNGILHGAGSHECDAKVIIADTVGESFCGKEFLAGYSKYRADYRRDVGPRDTKEAKSALSLGNAA